MQSHITKKNIDIDKIGKQDATKLFFKIYPWVKFVNNLYY